MSKIYMRTENNPIFEASPRTAARVLYLSTFIGNESGVLRKTQRTCMQLKHLSSVLSIGSTTAYEFTAEAKDLGLITETEYGLVLPNFSYRKRECGKRPLVVNQDGLSSLYRNIPARHVQYIGYVLNVFHYINDFYGIVCHNPQEDSIDDIEPFTFVEFSDMSGLQNASAKRVAQVLSTLTFQFDGKEQRFCSVGPGRKRAGMRIFVNPNIMYTGKHPENVEALGAFF